MLKLTELAAHYGISLRTLQNRIKEIETEYAETITVKQGNAKYLQEAFVPILEARLKVKTRAVEPVSTSAENPEPFNDADCMAIELVEVEMMPAISKYAVSRPVEMVRFQDDTALRMTTAQNLQTLAEATQTMRNALLGIAENDAQQIASEVEAIYSSKLAASKLEGLQKVIRAIN